MLASPWGKTVHTKITHVFEEELVGVLKQYVRMVDKYVKEKRVEIE